MEAGIKENIVFVKGKIC